MNLQSSARIKAFIAGITLSCFFLAAPGTTKAGIIYDNGMPMAVTFYVPQGIASDTDYIIESALAPEIDAWQETGDEFTLHEGENVITGVRWWGSRRDSSGGICVECNQVGEFSISIYEFISDEPGDEPVYTYNTGEIAPSSSDVLGVYEYCADIGSVTLDPEKRYLLSIVCHTGTPENEDDFWRWHVSDDSGVYWSREVHVTSGTPYNWQNSTGAELAFQLFGAAAIVEVLTYYIPYYMASDFQWTGVALKNRSAGETAYVSVYGMSQFGYLINSQDRAIPNRGQTAFLMPPGIGWIKVVSDQPLTGLAFVGEAFMMDITFISELSTVLDVPHVAQDDMWDTYVFVCNPHDTETICTLKVRTSGGVVAAIAPYVLPGNGSGVYSLSSILGGGILGSGSVEVTASQGVAAFALYENTKTGARSYAGISAVKPPEMPAPANFTNSIGMTFVPIPSGTFMMGSPASEPERYSDETRHLVTLTKSFYMQTTEVTQGQWKAVMGSNPSYFSSCGDDCPVEKVSWNDCQSFITKLNQLEVTTKYRLPTEAEWECACRAGATTPFNTGNCLSTSQANYNGNYPYTGCPSGAYHAKTVPMKSFSPNAWGLYDMHGNVWEWCQDWYGTYPSSSVTDPEGPSSGSYRVFRGGSWYGNAGFCRSAFRYDFTPGYWSSDLGFRVVRDF